MSPSSDDDIDLSLDTVFTEPPRPPTPEPTISTYLREIDGDVGDAGEERVAIKIKLVGSHPLWGHYLWNSARCISTYLDQNPHIYKNRLVLELGAGGGLPSIIAVLNGAKKVTLTDYPDQDLVKNMRFNVDENVKDERVRQRVVVQGYTWGTPIKPLLDALQPEPELGYHVLILSDLLFNHSQHDALLKTCEQALLPSNRSLTTGTAASSEPQTRTRTQADSEEPCILVFYTHHRPKYAHRDMEFFEKARGRGWICEEIVVRKYPPMFPDDTGAEEMRSTVHGWKLTRRSRSERSERSES